MSGDQAILRTTLVDGLVAAAPENVDAGQRRHRAVRARARLPAERASSCRRSAGASAASSRAASRRRAARSRCVYDALHLELRPTRDDGAVPPSRQGGARRRPGWFGELHPALLEGTWGVFELDLDELTAPIPERILYDDVITFPPLRQDIAVVVAEEVEAAALVDAALEAGAPELREARVFDVYRGDQVGEGRKSVAIHLSLQVPDRTLSDDDAAVVRERVVAALAERFGGELRG